MGGVVRRSTRGKGGMIREEVEDGNKWQPHSGSSRTCLGEVVRRSARGKRGRIREEVEDGNK